MFHGSRAPGSLIPAAPLFALVFLGGCQSSEPDRKITYTPVPGVADGQASRAAADVPGGSGAAHSPDARPNDPMNDPELARKGQDILKRTGGDVNKMTEAEKKTFFEAAKNGHL
jgi:hypothetical protein